MTSDSAGPADGASAIRALAFAAIPGYRPLELDLFRPSADGRAAGGPAARPLLPVVVYLHGGGWRAGARDMTAPAFRDWRPGVLHRVAAAGFAVVCPDYRLSGEARFPAQLDDVHRALDWVADHGAEHGIDADRVLLWGDSAGGHLALLAGLRAAARPTVRGVVAWYPVTDLLSIQADADAVDGESHNTADARETALLGGLISDRRELAADASPVRHVTAASPPCFLAHGTADLGVPFAQSVRMREALLGAGAEAALHPVHGVGHMWQGATDEQLHGLLNATVEFLLRCARANPAD